MAIYKIPQSVIDERNKAIALSVISTFTYKEGGLDIDKINPETLLKRYGISLDDAKKAVQSLLSEGKIEKIT